MIKIECTPMPAGEYPDPEILKECSRQMAEFSMAYLQDMKAARARRKKELKDFLKNLE